MTERTQLEQELDRRLDELESVEAADPAHAPLSARSLVLFLAVVVGVAAAAWIAVAL